MRIAEPVLAESMEEIVSAVKNADLLLRLKAKFVVTKIAVTAVVPPTVA